MANGSFVAYYRVSTARQGESGLGLASQQKAVKDFLNGGDWRLVAEITEIESGKNCERPKLAEALRLCRIHNATLVIAKMDRLARDAHFLLGLQKDLQKDGLKFVAADMPEANEMIVGIMAVVAQAERKMISNRTREALAAAKARGVVLGGDRGKLDTCRQKGIENSAIARSDNAEKHAKDLAPTIIELQASGASLRAVAEQLNAKSIPAARGGEWNAAGVKRVIDRVTVTTT